jgi:hypothetical protein
MRSRILFAVAGLAVAQEPAIKPPLPDHVQLGPGFKPAERPKWPVGTGAIPIPIQTGHTCSVPLLNAEINPNFDPKMSAPAGKDGASMPTATMPSPPCDDSTSPERLRYSVRPMRK